MSDLRNQLDSLRREYQTINYPGNLAADILRPARHIGRWLGVGTAIAASLVAAILLYQSPVTQPNIEVPWIEDERVIVPELPAGMELSPPAYDFSISTPTFTFLDNDQFEDTSTTREAV